MCHGFGHRRAGAVRPPPRLVYCEISAFGHTGPMALQPGYEPMIQAFSGLSATNGGPDDPPMRSGASLCDQGTGMWAVIGALALLQRRQHTGRGGIVSASLLETALVWNGQKADALVNEGRQPERHRSGHPGFVPYEAFETADEPLLICCGNDRLFAKLAQALINAAASSKDIQEKFAPIGFAVEPGTLDALAQRTRAETAKWAKAIKDAKIEAQ